MSSTLVPLSPHSRSRSMLVINRLAQRIYRDGIDVAHLLVGPGKFWVAALALRLRKMPVASTMIIPKPNVGEVMPASVIVAIYKVLAWGSDVIIVNGADQVGLVQECYGLSVDRIAYVPLGPRTTALKWAASKSPEEPGHRAILWHSAASQGAAVSRAGSAADHGSCSPRAYYDR